jgi:hypothetical protein
MDIARLYKSVCLARVLRYLDLKVITLERPRSNCMSKLQTPPLVREGAPRQETRNCQTEKKIWSWVQDVSWTPKQTGQLTVGYNLTSTSPSTSEAIPAWRQVRIPPPKRELKSQMRQYYMVMSPPQL